MNSETSFTIFSNFQLINNNFSPFIINQNINKIRLQ
jgi:hypothetical protein